MARRRLSSSTLAIIRSQMPGAGCGSASYRCSAMSADNDTALAEQRRKGLRVAFVVSVGFTSAVSLGAIVPFLVPIFAAQFLLGSPGPMPLGKTLGAALLILFTGIGMMVLTNLFGDRPSTFL